MARRGRKRTASVEREANGRLSRSRAASTVPIEAVMRRAAEIGVDPNALLQSGSKAVEAICRDQSAGTVIGRLTWSFSANGSRHRRMGDFGRRDGAGCPILEPIVTDDMVAAADAYRGLWTKWHRLTGLPRRHPQGQQFERRDRGEEGNNPLCRLPFGEPCHCPVCRVWERLRRAEESIRRCEAPVLVKAVLDEVVIEDFAAECFVLGERSIALRALRRGLLVIYDELCGGRNKTRLPI